MATRHRAPSTRCGPPILLARLLVAATVLVAAGCNDLGPVDLSRAELDANRLRWETLGPESYVYAVARNCFCPEEYRGPVRVRVVDGTAVERVYVSSGQPVPEEIAPSFPAVDGLFDVLRSAYEDEADEVRVTYDPELGVPIDFFIDYLEMAADEELGMQVTEEVAPTS